MDGIDDVLLWGEEGIGRNRKEEWGMGIKRNNARG